MNRIIAGLVLPFALGCGAAAADPSRIETRAVAMTSVHDLGAILPQLAAKRVVYVGEQHDRYDHHLNEFAIVQGIHARHPRLAIGMEMFQQPDQPALDAYIARQIDETEMLERTRFDRRWRDGFRQYAPILRYARDKGMPIVALNAPDGLVARLRSGGLAGLSEEDRARLPDTDRSDEGYRQRLERLYADHPGGHRDFERFLDVQLLWDESMAARAADYLKANPARRLVVIAGNGHVAYGSGIPRRVARRVKVSAAIVVQGDGLGMGARLADYVLFSDPATAPETP